MDTTFSLQYQFVENIIFYLYINDNAKFMSRIVNEIHYIHVFCN